MPILPFFPVFLGEIDFGGASHRPVHRFTVTKRAVSVGGAYRETWRGIFFATDFAIRTLVWQIEKEDRVLPLIVPIGSVVAYRRWNPFVYIDIQWAC